MEWVNTQKFELGARVNVILYAIFHPFSWHTNFKVLDFMKYEYLFYDSELTDDCWSLGSSG